MNIGVRKGGNGRPCYVIRLYGQRADVRDGHIGHTPFTGCFYH
jgi:hypothetical protein